jgi:hypothetical protein
MGHVTRPGPSWTILVPTIGERRPLFERLMEGLLPQLDAHEGRVQVLSWWNNGKPHLTQIRQEMVQAVTTDYLSCVDDDDLVPTYFVDETLQALATEPDYVGWRVQCYSDGVPTGISYHSMAYDGWWNEAHQYFRDFSHINPIRTDIAHRADFRAAKRGQPEDRAWVSQLRKLRKRGLISTEVVIPKIMYHYLFSTSRTAGIGSRWVAGARPGQFAPAKIDHPHFRYLVGGPDD